MKNHRKFILSFASIRKILCFFLLALFLLTGCEKSTPSHKETEKKKVAVGQPEALKHREINLKETKLAVIPGEYERWDNMVFSADGKQVSYRAKTKGTDLLAVASTNGNRTGPSYESIVWLSSSIDGGRFAYVGKRKDGKRDVVVDNKVIAEYKNNIEVTPEGFTPDGRLVICEVEDKEKKEWYVSLTDGKREVYRSRAYPETFRRPVISPDGRLLVYELGEVNKSKIFILDLLTMQIIKEQQICEGCTAGSFYFTSGASRIMYDLKKDGKNYFVLLDVASNKERTIELPYAMITNVALSQDGENIAYLVSKENHYMIVSTWESPLKGKERGPYGGVVPPFFTRDSRIVYAAMKGDQGLSVVGNKESAAKYDMIGGAPVISPDGAKIAYPALKALPGMKGMREKKGTWYMVVSPSDNPSAVMEGPGYDMVVTPVFSPDNRRVAYRARKGTMEKGKRFIVVADAETGKVIKEGPEGDEVWPPEWSADSKAVGYGARVDRELWWKIVKLLD